MMRSRRFAPTALLIAAALLPAAGCAPEPTTGELMQLEREFVAALASGDVERFSSFVADDAVFLGAGGTVLEGRSAILEDWSPLLEDPTMQLKWEPRRARLSPAGDMGFTYGEWRMTRESDEGSLLLGTGRYVSIWQRDDEGNWRVVLDVGNADETPRGELSF